VRQENTSRNATIDNRASTTKQSDSKRGAANE
jgi:hypothetical protein